jgi:hypothetical protein
MSIPPNGQRSSYTYASFDGSNDNDEKTREGKAPASNFLWWCAGAYQKLLRQYPSEYTKYSGIGGVILATFVLAGLSAGYAIYSVFGNIYWTILFAFIWGLIIFNFDRFLVATMRKYGVSFSKQLQLALPRFILALLIGITIARPLELKIFEKEIDVKVAENRHKKILLNDSLLQRENTRVLQTAMAERQRAASRKTALEDSLRRLQADYVMEADGTGGSGKRGIEQLTRLKMDAYNTALKQYGPEMQQLQSQIITQDSILKSMQEITEQKRKTYETGLQTKVGFLERNKALSDLSNEETSVFWANFFVSLLIILIEIGPILSKLIVNVGPYDIALAKMELLQMASSENEIIRDKEMVGDKFKHIYQQKKAVSDELVQKITALQREHIEKELGLWNKGEWDKPSSIKPLDDVIKTIKDKYDYKEENIL